MARSINKLTDVSIRGWLNAGQPIAKADGGGLTFTLSAKGTATWVLRYRHVGKPRELTLGNYPDLSLRAARERSRDERAKIQRGIDVATERQREKRYALSAVSFRQLCEDYQSKVMPDLSASTIKQRLQHFKAHILPVIGGIPCREVTPDDIVSLVRKVGIKTTPNIAELVLTAMSEVFKHGQRTSAVTVNPCFGLQAFAIAGRPEVKRQRLMLSEDELRVLLPNLYLLGKENALAVRIQLATCCRIGELARAQWEHVDFGNRTWSIPDENSKNGEGFTIPLPDAVLGWIQELRPLSCGSHFILPARQARRQKTHGKPMHYEPRALNAVLNKVLPKLEGIRRFTPHDLRSTARSHLAALKVNVIVAERCLNHAIGGLVGIYDKHDYLDERRDAINMWTDFLLTCETEKNLAT